MATGTAYVSEFNDATSGKFKTNTTKDIGSDDLRDLVTRTEESFFNLTDDAYAGAKGFAPGINTVANLKAIVTAGSSSVLVGVMIAFRDTGDSNNLKVYQLTTGTTAESLPGVVRPNDFDATTNPKVWIYAPSGGGGGGGSITSVNGDVGPAVTLDASDIGTTAAGGLSSTNVQAAVNELDTEKASLAYADGKVASTITNGVTTSAPSQDAVFDALAGKETAGAAAAALTSAQTYADGKVAATITNGVTTSAPNQDAVFDALALKVAKAGDTMTGNLAFGGAQKNTGLAAGTTAGDSVRFEQVMTDFITLTDGATVTWTIPTTQQTPQAILGTTRTTLTLAFSGGPKSGAVGIWKLVVNQTATLVVTFPSGSKMQNVSLTTFTFPAGTSGREYFLFFAVEGSNYEWTTNVPNQPLASTGTAIAFDVDRHYGFPTAETGNITLDSTNFTPGITQLVRHNSGSVPSFSSPFQVISGSYLISVKNNLWMYAISATEIHVTIYQST